jgi:hypothetical protein
MHVHHVHVTLCRMDETAVVVHRSLHYTITLDDGEERARDNPDRFEIPAQGKRENLRVGDFAKLIFTCTPQLPSGQTGERMWVKVTHVYAPGRYRGELYNDPSEAPFTKLRYGDKITFEARHIINIEPANDA